MTAQRWTRERANAGPADTLDGRYEIQRRDGRWVIWDRRRTRYLPGSYRTMRDARRVAETYAEYVP